MILFTCTQCGASLQVQDRLIGQFTNCLSCRSSVPVPIPDVADGLAAVPAEALLDEPVAATSPITANPSPFAYLDDTGGPSVTASGFAEQAHGTSGWDGLGTAAAALVLTFIPGCNLLAPLLALLGLVLSIDGIIKCNDGIPDASGMGVYISGLVLSLVVGGFWGTMLLNAVVRGTMG